VVALESWRKGSSARTVKSLVDEGRMRRGQLLVGCVTGMAEAHKKLVPLIIKSSLTQQAEEENQGLADTGSPGTWRAAIKRRWWWL